MLEGYLKITGGINFAPKSQYFQLWLNPPIFSYYKVHGGELMETIRLQGPNDSILDSSNDLEFVLQTKERSWTFRAETQAERDSWKEGFYRACEAANMASVRGTGMLREDFWNKEEDEEERAELRIRVSQVIETEGLVYFHCIAEATVGEEMFRAARILHFGQLSELHSRIKQFYEENHPIHGDFIPDFPTKDFFENESDFMIKINARLATYFELLCRVERMALCDVLWNYMGLASKRTVVVTNGDSLLGNAILSAMVKQTTSKFSLHTTVCNAKASAHKFVEFASQVTVQRPRHQKQHIRHVPTLGARTREPLRPVE